MPTSDAPALSLAEAHQLLKQFDCITPAVGTVDQAGAADSQADRLQTRQALLTVAHHSDYQMFGVCADSFEQGRDALERYAKALGYLPELNFSPVAGEVYLKFNPKSGRCYGDHYAGDRRGVLVSCQSADADGLNEIYGHLPLDLFD